MGKESDTEVSCLHCYLTSTVNEECFGRWEGGVSISCEKVSNLRFAKSEGDTYRSVSAQYGLYIKASQRSMISNNKSNELDIMRRIHLENTAITKLNKNTL